MLESVRNALTVDVEDYFHVSAMAKAIDRGMWNEMPPRVDRNTRRLLDIFEERGVRGTFFVLGVVAERFPALVQEIHRRGHEVASHGFAHELVYRQAPAQFRAETKQSKAMLEELTGAPVVGYRAASYSVIEETLWALDVLLEEGFRYDSSVYPIRHDLYGIPGSSPTPHRLRTPCGGEIVEFPAPTVVFLGQNLPVGGGGYFRLYPYALTRALLARVLRQRGQPFTFYLHPWEIDPDQPKIKASPLSTFRHYHNLHRCEARLERLLGDFRFDTMRNVLRGLGYLKDSNGPPAASPPNSSWSAAVV
jgi:polysaccharide deacetylase family protein (PEP-CTERM system associated)